MSNCVPRRNALTRLCNGAKWVMYLYFFSVNKWNRFQDTSGFQYKLVWLSCVRGGGGTGVVYVACSCYHCCGIFSIGMSHPIFDVQ